MSDIRDDTRAGFAETFGHEASGVWSAPGSVSLIGCERAGGLTLSFAINRRTVAAAAGRDDRVLRVASTYADEVAEIELDALSPDAVSGWAAYPLGVAWALGEHGADLAAVPGLDIFIDSDVAVGAGMSSSSAIESVIALALNDVWQLGLDEHTLALACQLAETRAVGVVTGISNQLAALLGASDSAVLLDGSHTQLVELGFASEDLVLVVIDTGQAQTDADGHDASCAVGAALSGVSSLRELGIDDLPRARATLDDATFRRVRHEITENQRVLDTVRLLHEGDAAAIGPLLDASHESLRDDAALSMPELDLAVETAQANGAVGARASGSAAIALVPREGVSRLQVAIDGAFAEHSFGQPEMFVVAPSHGARREP